MIKKQNETPREITMAEFMKLSNKDKVRLSLEKKIIIKGVK